MTKHQSRFQSLIGRLKTACEVCEGFFGGEFQSLIGRLKTDLKWRIRAAVASVSFNPS